MEMHFRNRGIHNYLSVQLSEDINQLGIYHIKMIEENEILGFIQPISENIEGRISLNYNVDAHRVFSEYVDRSTVDGKFFAEVVTKLGRCIEEISHYLLSPNHIVLDIDYMFVDMDGEIHFVYAPGYDVDIRVQVKRLLEHLMRIFDSKDGDGIRKLYELYSLVSSKHSDFQKALDWIHEELKEGETGILDTELLEADVINTELLVVDDEPQQEVKGVKLSPVQIAVLLVNIIGIIALIAHYIMVDHNMVSLYFAGGLIALLFVIGMYYFVEKEEDPEEAMQEFEKTHREEKQHSLVPLNDGSLSKLEIANDKKCIVVGRGAKEADYRLTAGEISRIHAYILVRNDGLFLQDQNSTNGTFLNSNRLLPKEIRKIKTGDIIAFANEEFFVS